MSLTQTNKKKVMDKKVTCAHSEHLHNVQDLSAQDIAQRIEAAVAHCDKRRVRFTLLRQQIYELVLAASQPIGAYDLINQLQQIRLLENTHNTHADDTFKKSQPKNVAPPTVYRSLEFLLSEGLIHQLTSINAYVPCCHPRVKHTAAFLICEQCQQVQECSSLPVQEMMSFAEQNAGFMVSRSVIELSGRCQACQ